jgi:hypothetical protein
LTFPAAVDQFATSPARLALAPGTGQGPGFIGVADATAASHNPAGLVLERPEVSAVGSYFALGTQDITQPDTDLADQNLHHFDPNYLSAVYPFEFLQRNVVVSPTFSVS